MARGVRRLGLSSPERERRRFKMTSRYRSCFVAVAFTAVLACGAPSNPMTLQGSGATFPAPLYKRWFLEYYREPPAVRVNYSPIGSGAGIRQFTAGLVTFG